MILQYFLCFIQIVYIHTDRYHILVDVFSLYDIHAKTIRVFHPYANDVFSAFKIILFMTSFKTKIFKQFDGTLRIRC